MIQHAVKQLIHLFIILWLCTPGFSGAQRSKNPNSVLPVADPAAVGMSAERLAQIEAIVNESISKRELPGAVVLVARHGRVVYRRALGHRAVQPQQAPMTLDTMFDLASLTKVVATATSVMILAERGLIRLGDRVSRYIPEFGRNGKESVTIEHLLTHRAGFVPDNDIVDYQQGPAEAMQRIYSLSPIYEPGTRFVYSDVGFIVLGELVQRVSGQRLDVFAHQHIFHPLGMHQTTFSPDPILRERAAPTEQRDGRWMMGEVHDPRAYLLGGVAGHAGLFSTADDLAIYCQMILSGGEYNGVRILSPLGVQRMTGARGLPQNEARGLGWDINTGYSANRGDFFLVGSFGHTGFTGTSLWIDPEMETFVVFLSNRVHPDGKGDVGSLRGRVASVVAAAILEKTQDPRPKTQDQEKRATQTVLTGIDVLTRDGFKQLAGRRVGLITNHTGKDRDGTSTIDLLHGAKNLTLVSLFSPEHGIRGVADEAVGDTRDEKTGLPVYSLYGDRRRPTPDTLKGIDTLVFDIQDIGARFYTYITTLGYAMEEAARAGLRFVVLDRPNPINGIDVEGPVADPDSLSFTAYHPVPVRHGMTVGELARLFNAQRKIGADLQVIQVEGWRREGWFDQTGLTWINPSPNMRSLVAAALYPGIGLLETTNLSVGRGTARPFELVGAPWLDGRRWAERLNTAGLAGVRFVPVEFTPSSSVFAGERCSGVNILITDRHQFEPIGTGIEMAVALRELYPNQWLVDRYSRLLANRAVLEALKAGQGAEVLRNLWQAELGHFKRMREKYLLYP